MYGLPMCGFAAGPPVLWPAGETWVAFNDDAASETATCPDCKQALDELDSPKDKEGG